MDISHACEKRCLQLKTNDSGHGGSIGLRLFMGATGLASIRSDWKRLCEQAGATGLMQNPEYYESFAEILGQGGRDFIAAAFVADDRLIAVLPLSVSERRRFGLRYRVVSFPETPIPVRSYAASHDVTIEDLANVLQRCFRSEFGKNWDALSLCGYTSYADDMEVESSDAGGSVLARIGKNNYIDLSQPDYFNRELSPNMRSNLRRRTRRLAEAGNFEFRTIDDFPALDAAFETFVETEAAGWKSHRGGKRAIKLHEDQRAFYRDLLERFAKDGNAHIHLLNLEGQTIAADYVLICGDVAYSLKHGYDEDFSDFTPSNLLRQYTIEFYEASDRISKIDLISGYQWQDRWKPKSRTVYEIRRFNNTAKGLLLKINSRLDGLRRGAAAV